MFMSRQHSLRECWLARLYRRARARILWSRVRTINVGRLPIDVLELVFEACCELRFDAEGRRTLTIAARVCRVWHYLAMRHLYRGVYIASKHTANRLLVSLNKHPHLRPLVRDYYFAYPAFDRDVDFSLKEPFLPSFQEGICRLCPNLASEVHFERPWLETHRNRLEGLKQLTHLSIMHSSPEHWDISPSSIELPALRSLEVSRIVLYEQKIEWFRMPRLRRLSLIQASIPHSMKLSLPDHSPLVHTIEIISCSFYVVRDLFDPKSGPLLPFRNSLERLTLKAYTESSGLPRPPACRSLGFLGGLKQLCFPFLWFATGNIDSYPPNLIEFALIGRCRENYASYVPSGCDKLRNLFVCREENGLRKLKRVIAAVAYKERIDFEYKKINCKLDVDSMNSPW